MNLIKTRRPDSFVVSGTWGETSTLISPSEGVDYTFDGGTFRDFTGSTSSRSYTFIKDPQFLSVPFTEEVLENTPGSHKIVKITTNGKGFRKYRLNLSVSAPVVNNKFLGFTTTYGQEVFAEFTSKMTAGKTVNLFTNDGTRWDRNCWGFDYDMTGIITSNNFAGFWSKERGGFAITPRHIVNAGHYPFRVGTNVRFITRGATPAQDTVITRSIVRDSRVGNHSNDNAIYLLDSDLPSSIHPISYISAPLTRRSTVMAGKYGDLIVSTASDKSTLGGGFDNRLWKTVGSGVDDPVHVAGIIDTWAPIWSPYKAFIRSVLSGDSGSPHLNYFDGQLGFKRISTGANLIDLNAAIASIDAAHGISTAYTVNEIS